MVLQNPRTDIIKLLISTPSYFIGHYESEAFSIANVNNNLGIVSAHPSERTYKQYLELTIITPEYKRDTIVVPDYSHQGENMCIAMSVLFGKVFDSHGLLLQHGQPYLPNISNNNRIYNKNLTINSSTPRADYCIDLNLSNVNLIADVLFEHDDETSKANSTFWYAGRFYLQALRLVEDNPELAFLSLITTGEILASYFNYDTDELLDDDSKKLLQQLKDLGEEGSKLHRKVSKKMMGISAAFCKFLIDRLDDEFFERTEAKDRAQKLNKDDIKARLKSAYNLRSIYVHAGQAPTTWMSVSYIKKNEEVHQHSPALTDREMSKTLKRSPTFIGMERIIRYSLLKFLIETGVIKDIKL